MIYRMETKSFVKFLFCLMTVACLLSAYAMSFAQEAPYKGGDLIVQLKNSRTTDSLTNSLSSINLKPVKLLSHRLNIWLFSFNPSLAASDGNALAAVRSHADVHLAQFNHFVTERVVPNDTRFGDQWALNNTGQTGGTPDADVDAPEAWDINTSGVTALGDQVVVAVIDGGADLSHEDLDFFKNLLEIPGNGIDDDGNGYIDDYDGWNAYDSNGSIPSSFHGTHVSGITAAIGNNAKGVSGVNWGAKVMPVAGSSGTESVVVEAYGYVLEMRTRYNATNGAEGAFVVATNASFGVDQGDPANFPIWCSMYDTMGSAGILSAAATANANWDIDVVGDVPTACPSNYLISVTNTTDIDQKNPGAAFGATTIDLGAPGTAILSTLPGNAYGDMTGTSMATPHVAGAVALQVASAPTSLLTQYDTSPGPTALTIRSNLLDNVDPIGALSGITVTGGRLNLNNMLLALGSAGEGCYETHPTPGCDLPDCQDAVCAVDAFCCAVEWDSLCVDEASLYCAGMSCYEPQSTPGCMDAGCEAAVCAVDPYCCATAWDSICVEEAHTLCGGGPDLVIQSIATVPTAPAPGDMVTVTLSVLNQGTADASTPFGVDFFKDRATAPAVGELGDAFCGISGLAAGASTDCVVDVTYETAGTFNMWGIADTPDAVVESDETNNVFGPQPIVVEELSSGCYDTHPTPGCDTAECQEAVCALDPFCCDVLWDSLCVSEATDTCYSCTIPHVDHPTPTGCSDAECEATVCAADPFCCDTAWDALCADEASTMCGAVSAVSVTLTPDAVSVPLGGTLGYNVTATNNTAITQCFDYWTNVNLPAGSVYPFTGELFGPYFLCLSPSASQTAHLTHAIPTKAPLGTYMYNAYVGPYPTVLDETHFNFTVTAPTAAQSPGGGGSTDWSLIENSFED